MTGVYLFVAILSKNSDSYVALACYVGAMVAASGVLAFVARLYGAPKLATVYLQNHDHIPIAVELTMHVKIVRLAPACAINLTKVTGCEMPMLTCSSLRRLDTQRRCYSLRRQVLG